MIENASIAHPRLGSHSPVIPARVLEIASQVRSGKLSVDAANRALGTRAKSSGSEDVRRKAALAAANGRLAKYAKGR